MKLTYQTSLLLLWILLSTTTSAKTVILAATDNPPFYGQQLRNQGALTEIIAESFTQVGHNIEVRYMPWARAVESVRSGVVDGMIGVWHTPLRAEFLFFSEPILTSRMVLYKRKDQTIEFNNIEDLNRQQYKLGLVRGYVLPEQLRGTTMPIMRITRNEQYFKILAGKRVDLIVVNNEYAHYLLQKLQNRELAEQVERIGDIVGVENQHLVLTKKFKSNKKLMKDFNRGLTQLRQSGSVLKILERHNFEDIDEATAFSQQLMAPK